MIIYTTFFIFSDVDSRPKLGKLPTMLRSLKARNASFSIKSYGSSGRRSDGQIALQQQEEKLEEITDKLDAIRGELEEFVSPHQSSLSVCLHPTVEFRLLHNKK